jgi:hypothetical protein
MAQYRALGVIKSPFRDPTWGEWLKDNSSAKDHNKALQIQQETSKPRDSGSRKLYSPEFAASLRQLAEVAKAEATSGPITKKRYLYDPVLASEFRQLVENQEAMTQRESLQG